jgi:predicted Zn-dependent protease
MKTRPLLLSLAAAFAATAAVAQFGGLDLGKISKAIDTGKAGAKVFKGAVGIGPVEERKIGEATAVEIIGRYGGLVRDDAIMHRVNLLGRSLARYSSRPNLSWGFAVLDSDTVNAFSTPGGLVFITRGLYEQAGSDDALAGALGHEIAHITNRDALKIVQRGDVTSGAKDLLVQRSAQARAVDSTVSQVGSLLGFDVLGLVKKIVESGFDAPTEFAADKDGRNLATQTGYAPGGLRSVLVHLQAKGENRKTMFATHPPLADRLKKLPNDPPPPEVVADAKDQPGGQAK